MDFDPPEVLAKLNHLSEKENKIPPLWDGSATERIAEKLNEIFSD